MCLRNSTLRESDELINNSEYIIGSGRKWLVINAIEEKDMEKYIQMTSLKINFLTKFIGYIETQCQSNRK